jgi:hypothetical protein
MDVFIMYLDVKCYVPNHIFSLVTAIDPKSKHSSHAIAMFLLYILETVFCSDFFSLISAHAIKNSSVRRKLRSIHTFPALVLFVVENKIIKEFCLLGWNALLSFEKSAEVSEEYISSIFRVEE